MKKLIILMLAHLALSGLVAVELKYWANEAYLQNIPRLYTNGNNLTKVATIFTPPADCTLEGVRFPFYLPGAVGQANVTIQIWAVDATGLPSGMLPFTAATINYADLINWATGTPPDDYNYVDFSAAGLEFGPTGANGTAFAMALYSPNGVVPTISTATLHDNASRGNSYNYYTAPTAGWSQWYDYCFSAEVTYAGDQIDVSASNLTFTGDFFLAPGEVITYEADVQNYSVDNLGASIAVSDVNAYLGLWDYSLAEEDQLLWSEQILTNGTLAADEELHIDTISSHAMPLTGGRYVLQLMVEHASDTTLSNDNLYLQQDVVVLPTALAYDESDGSTTHGNMAHAFYDAGTGWANAFKYYGAPMKITEVSFDMRDNTWPAGALGNLSYAIFADNGDGYPDMDNPLVPITAATCTLGAWNSYNVSSYNIVIPAGETFYIAYFQVGDYGTGAPGLMGDQSEPISSWATSYAYYYDEDLSEWVWETPNAYDEDMCIRCSVEASMEAPIVSMSLDGDPTIAWAEVPGALSYNVYGSNDPEAERPWTVIETGIVDLGYAYQGTETYKFFYVTASTQADGSKKGLSPQMNVSRPTKLPTRSNVISDMAAKNEIKIIQATIK